MAVVVGACSGGVGASTSSTGAPSATLAVPTTTAAAVAPITTSITTAAAHSSTAHLDQLDPGSLVYAGAFRLPMGPDADEWGWSGAALTFNPDGGSLFGTGHNHRQLVSEFSIPAPIVASEPGALNVATTIQPFTDIRGGLFEFGSFELPRVGLEYLDGKIHFAWGQHFEEDGPFATHGWASADLANPDPAGPWPIAGVPVYASNDYVFAIDPSWVDSHLPGYPLATGRYRDGGWGGQGPALYAYAPGEAAPGEPLDAVPLIQYGSSLDLSDLTLDGYHHSDEWTGGAWVSGPAGSAVLIVGTKGLGECWYGFENGVVWPDAPPFPDIPPAPYDDRGWWSSGFEAQILFYDPFDLAAVAAGTIRPHDLQPYAVLSIDDVLMGQRRSAQQYRTGGVAYDPAGSLFVMEPHADGERPLVHIWRVGG